MPHHHLYTSLNTTWERELRLVTLLPAPTKDAPIECTLSIISLEDQNTQYEALSYEWGDPNGPQYEILLDGQPFTVRRNLWQALRCLRTEYSARTLWVDAVCINQEDVFERNHQVGMMGSIYNCASSVRVWLGEKGNNSRDAILLLHEIWDSFEEVSRPSQEIAEKAKALRKKLAERNARPASPTGRFDSFEELPLEPIERIGEEQREDVWWDELSGNPMDLLVQERRAAWLRRMAGGSEPNGPWEGVAALVERTYWSRIWIVQEYLLASEIIVQCGWDYMDGKRFGKAISKIGELAELKTGNQTLPPSIQTSLEICRQRHSHGKRTLLELMETCKSSKSEDPHDRIFAILGLANDVSREAIVVDYERSIFKVKMDVAWWYSTRSRLKSDRASVSRVCSLLDEIFEDCEEEEEG
jgi:hypothetical protein